MLRFDFETVAKWSFAAAPGFRFDNLRKKRQPGSLFIKLLQFWTCPKFENLNSLCFLFFEAGEGLLLVFIFLKCRKDLLIVRNVKLNWMKLVFLFLLLFLFLFYFYSFIDFEFSFWCRLVRKNCSYVVVRRFLFLRFLLFWFLSSRFAVFKFFWGCEFCRFYKDWIL